MSQLSTDKDCRLCSHAIKDDKYTKRGRIYCDLRKAEVLICRAMKRGNTCRCLDVIPEILEVHRLLQQGQQYADTGDPRVFTGRYRKANGIPYAFTRTTGIS